MTACRFCLHPPYHRWMWINTFMEPPLNQAVSSYSDHDNGSLALFHLCEHIYKAPTTQLATPWRCIFYKYLFRGTEIHTASPDPNERGQLPSFTWRWVSCIRPSSRSPQPQNGGSNKTGTPHYLTK